MPTSTTTWGSPSRCWGRSEEALRSVQRAIQLRPDFAAAHNNLGAVLKDQRRLEEAAASYQKAIQLQPDYAAAYNNLGGALRVLGRLEEAAASYQRAIQLEPEFAEAHRILGVVLSDQGRLEEAAASYQRAIRLEPDFAEAHKMLGVVLHQARAAGGGGGQLSTGDPAQARLRRGAQSLGKAWLLVGRFEQGWPEYEVALEVRRIALPTRSQAPSGMARPWADEPSCSSTQQGLGDTLQFIRYAPLVAQRGGRVIVACPQPLLRLLASCPGVGGGGRGGPLPSSTSMPR